MGEAGKSPAIPALMQGEAESLPMLSFSSFPQSGGEGVGVLGRGRTLSNIIEIGKTFLIEQAGVAFIILVQEIQ